MKKKWIFYLFVFLIVITGFPFSIAKNLVRKNCIEIEGNVTTLIDLCNAKHRGEILEMNKDIDDMILTGQIKGLERYKFGKFSEDVRRPLFFRNLYGSSDLPYKSCSALTPVLKDIEIFEKNGEYFVKVFYITDKASSGFYAVYQFVDLDKREMKVFLQNAV